MRADFIVSFEIDAPNAKAAHGFLHQLLDEGRIAAEANSEIRVMDMEQGRVVDMSAFHRTREEGDT